MKGTLIIGMAAGTLLGATAAWALSGDLNAKGMNRITRKISKGASRLGIER